MIKFKKLITSLSITIIGAIILCNKVQAQINLPSNLSEAYDVSGTSEFTMAGKIIYVAQIIFYAAAVIALIIAGLKYMDTAPEAKAEFKKKMIYIAIGAVMLFAAGSLVRLIGGLAMKNI